MGRIAKIWSFIKTLRVEPYLFIHMFGTAVASVTIGLLAQDKICVNVYNQTNDFCANLNQITSQDDPGGYKDQILKFSTQMGLYSTLMESIPSVIWSLFIGSFTDKFLNGRKVVICLSSICGIMVSLIHILNAYFFHWSPYYLLFTVLPPMFTGGGFGYFMAVYSYVSLNTKESMRSVRFALVEFSFVLGNPLGTYVGGALLKTIPNSSGGQLYNYITIITVSLVFQVIAFIIVMVLVNEKRDRHLSETDALVEDLDGNSNEVKEVSYKREVSTLSQDSQTYRKWYYPIDLLFDIENVKEVWICCTKKRPNSARLEIWLLFMSMCIMVITLIGTMKTQFQFSEKVYLWSATFYSNVNAISSIVHSVLMTLAVPLLVLKMKVVDTHLTMIGLLSGIFRNIIIGSYQHPIAYYISVVISSIGGMISIGIRSKLSKLVDKKELGKVFSLLSTLEAVTPLVASLVFTFLFEWSIGFFPGLIYEVCAGLMIVALVAIVYIDLKIDSKRDSISTIN